MILHRQAPPDADARSLAIALVCALALPGDWSCRPDAGAEVPASLPENVAADSVPRPPELELLDGPLSRIG